MFKSKSFNLSGFMSKASKQDSRISCVLQPPNYEKQQKQKELQKVKQQNQEIKSQLQKLKQLFIETRIEYDTQIRAYDQLIQQLRTQLGENQSLLEKYADSLRQDLPNQGIIEKAEQEENQNYQENNQQQNNLKRCQLINGHYEKQVSELLLQSTVGIKQKYQVSLHQIQNLKLECQRLKHQLHLSNEKNSNHLLMTNDISFTGKGGSRISFDFGDITSELRDVDDIAQFSHGHSQVTVDQEEITIRQERIDNLQRQNFELQHQIASKSHKIARIFNAAYQFGGMQLLDYLQSSIGLVEKDEEECQ